MSEKNSPPLFLLPVRQRVVSMESLFLSVFNTVSGAPDFISEIEGLTEVGVKFSGIKKGDNPQLSLINYDVNMVRQPLDNDSDFILSIVTNIGAEDGV